MFDNGIEGPVPGNDGALAALLAGLNRDPRFGPLLCAPDAVLLVLDASGTRLVHASPAAAPLARAIAADGAVSPALRLGAQMRATAEPTLTRIQFDRRGVAVPTTCFVARRALADGRAVIVLVPVAPLPRLRPVAAAPSQAGPSSPAPVSDEPTEAAMPPAGTVPRFTWATDASGILVRVDGPAGALLRGTILGRSWPALSRAGIVRDGEGLISVLAAQRTFRAIPLGIRRASGECVEFELSGAPLARSGQAPRGFAGFGLVRSVEAAPMPQAAPAPILPSVPVPPPESASRPEAVAPPPPETVVPEATAPVPVIAPEQEPEPETCEAPAPEPSLTVHEHAAFREIARALGARFAGDEAEEAPAREAAGPSGDVMPFPAPALPAAPDAAVAATLDRLPTGVLVYRGADLLFANRHLLDLADFPDLDAVVAAGGLACLFRGLPPHERPASDAPAILTDRSGAHRGVDLQTSVIDWAGRPAQLVLARDAAADEPARARTAERIARDFAAHRADEVLGILDILDDGIVTLDGSARILGLNRRAATLFGTDPREVVGESLLGLFTPESAVDVLALAHGVSDAGHTVVEMRDVTGRGPDGPVPLRLGVRAVAGTAEIRLCAILRPVSDWVGSPAEALRVAEMASARKSEFLAHVSHAIRTPMSGILGFADLMLTEPFGALGSDRYRTYLGDIRQSGTQILTLVDDLIDLARIEAGRLDLAFTEIPLNDLVSRCVAQMQPEAARERIVVRTSFSTDLAPLVADEPSLRQAALTVIANAIRFTEAGGQVIVSTTMADRGEVALRVRDTGIGLTPAEIDTLLEPYRAAPVPGPRPGTGSGLGLPITKALVEANRGEFRITSRKDEGTLVEMLFPPAQASRSA
ncbi:PAS fold [Methylobacterium gossipiicola]|uniref:histidine kinase n=2 Tax=Methylobacterium gossipiicola TaxID=582675 RepID=A0A1I2WGJ2_9HYPH|nr:PAS fold [Methylobacterium gossipiicola]